jgi:type II secretory ATPase GspE/PulE/Tfp pilus assembly ATPase PilB-like protein
MTDEQLARALHGAGLATIDTLKAVAMQRHRGETLAHALLRLDILPPGDILRFDPKAFDGTPWERDEEFETAGEMGLGTETPALGDFDIYFDEDREGSNDVSLAPVVRWSNELLRLALSLGASDLHLEPRPDGMLPRYRIDGALRSGNLLPLDLVAPVTSRFKVLAHLDITEQRVPQDGRFRAFVGGRPYDFRVSTLPSLHGEKTVMRILDRSSLVTDLTKLGFTPGMRTDFESLLKRSHGMILVTGPTGSGKTTTLYAALSAARDDTRNVITIEDPVEYELEGVTQAPVNEDVGLTFAAALRSILRQDPDVILVGEIRDNETADISVRAALTGHLLLSTLHTNSAVGAITRLQDMDVEPYLIASSLAGVLAQRLVKMNCRHCRSPLLEGEPEREEAIQALGLPADSQLWKGRGCDRCGGTGFKGRVAILELLLVDSKLRRAIVNKAPADELKQIARADGFRTLWQDGKDKLLSGITSPGEVMKALLGHEEE